MLSDSAILVVTFRVFRCRIPRFSLSLSAFFIVGLHDRQPFRAPQKTGGTGTSQHRPPCEPKPWTSQAYTLATALISTLPPPGSAATWNAARAGYGASKNSA